MYHWYFVLQVFILFYLKLPIPVLIIDMFCCKGILFPFKTTPTRGLYMETLRKINSNFCPRLRIKKRTLNNHKKTQILICFYSCDIKSKGI